MIAEYEWRRPDREYSLARFVARDRGHATSAPVQAPAPIKAHPATHAHASNGIHASRTSSSTEAYARHPTLSNRPVWFDEDYDSSWDTFVPLPSADIRLKARPGRRPAMIMAALATITLTAACASAVRSTTDKVKPTALSANELTQRQASAAPLPNWRALRAARPPTPAYDTKTAVLGKAPFSGAPSVVEDHQPDQQATIEDQPDLRQSPSLFGESRRALRRPVTELVAFNSAPFPYDGMQPQGGPFLDVEENGQKGHRTRRGQVLWESTTFNDRRVLVHMPSGFDPYRPAVMVVFFHGFGATLTRDVLARQQVPAQISASGANAVLLAPQFAVDARDASIGRFWEHGGFSRFLSEASQRLADLQGDPSLRRRFARMPIVLVAYSGGFVPAAWSLKDLGATRRVRGVLLLDAAYGELERFANFAASNRSSFLVSAYTHYTQRQNAALEQLLAARGISASTEMAGSLSRGGAIFLATGADASHNDYVTQAWTGDPIADILARLPEFRFHDPQTVASVDRSIVLGTDDITGSIR